MAFGQAAGPPARQKQVDELASLLEARGYDSFREARHPFGLTQRQAGGKFTVGEVEELIERLEADGVAPVSKIVTARKPATAVAEGRAALRQHERDAETAVGLDADAMATELVNRGWCCIPPD